MFNICINLEILGVALQQKIAKLIESEHCILWYNIKNREMWIESEKWTLSYSPSWIAKARIVNEVYLNSFEQSLSKQILKGLLSVKLKGARRLDTTLIRAYYALSDARKWPFWPFHLPSFFVWASTLIYGNYQILWGDQGRFSSKIRSIMFHNTFKNLGISIRCCFAIYIIICHVLDFNR